MKDLLYTFGHAVKTFKFIKTGSTEYKVVVFENETLECTFLMTLQPPNNTRDTLPTYQLYPENQNIPDWVLNEDIGILPILSNYIIEIE
jgi:hypothetical protein